MKCRSWRGTVTCVRREKVEKLQMDEKERYRGGLPVQCEVVRSRSLGALSAVTGCRLQHLSGLHASNADHVQPYIR
eukprot:4944342-Heterocapsa_arctica.AAC.1